MNLVYPLFMENVSKEMYSLVQQIFYLIISENHPITIIFYTCFILAVYVLYIMVTDILIKHLRL